MIGEAICSAGMARDALRRAKDDQEIPAVDFRQIVAMAIPSHVRRGRRHARNRGASL